METGPVPRRRGGPIGPTAALALAALLALAPAAAAGEILFADGRREPVQEPRKDSQGRWTATREGRRTILRPGEVVVVVDDEGKETETIPPLADPPDGPGAAPALADLADPKSQTWRRSAETLAGKPTKAVLEALVALGKDPRKAVRARAIAALARQRTREGVAAAAAAILAEKDAALRRDAASELFPVTEIFRRLQTRELAERGIADRDPMVRIDFALVAPRDLAAGTEVLRTVGLKHADHHVRERAALELGHRGDGSGEAILAGMLARDRLPGLEDDRPTMERLMAKEKVEVCGILGRLGTETAREALRKAAARGPEEVRKAAERALAAMPPE
jgi:HEAT repeat protein